MRIKLEHLLIVIIVLIGLYLLMNRCRCNGFSVGNPYLSFRKELMNPSGGGDVYNMLSYVDSKPTEMLGAYTYYESLKEYSDALGIDLPIIYLGKFQVISIEKRYMTNS